MATRSWRSCARSSVGEIASFPPCRARGTPGGARHYTEIQSELGGRFYDAMDKLVREIRVQPTVFRMFDPPAHRHFGSKFPYAIVFLDLPDHVWVVAVMHFKQRPGYWVERLA